MCGISYIQMDKRSKIVSPFISCVESDYPVSNTNCHDQMCRIRWRLLFLWQGQILQNWTYHSDIKLVSWCQMKPHNQRGWFAYCTSINSQCAFIVFYTAWHKGWCAHVTQPTPCAHIMMRDPNARDIYNFLCVSMLICNDFILSDYYYYLYCQTSSF